MVGLENWKWEDDEGEENKGGVEEKEEEERLRLRDMVYICGVRGCCLFLGKRVGREGYRFSTCVCPIGLKTTRND